MSKSKMDKRKTHRSFAEVAGWLLRRLPATTSSQLNLLEHLEIAVASRRRLLKRHQEPFKRAATLPPPPPLHDATTAASRAGCSVPSDPIRPCTTALATSAAPRRGGRRRRLPLAEGALTTLTGSQATRAPGFADGAASGARCSSPWGMAVNPIDDSLTVSDVHNLCLRSLALRPRRDEEDAGDVALTVSTLAGSGEEGATDGRGAAASFRGVFCIGLDTTHAGRRRLLVTDAGNRTVRAVTLPEGEVTTLAGSGAIGAADGPCAAATFVYPFGLAVAPETGVVYVSDQQAHNIRAISPEVGFRCLCRVVCARHRPHCKSRPQRPNSEPRTTARRLSRLD